jgi:hypothetical protein
LSALPEVAPVFVLLPQVMPVALRPEFEAVPRAFVHEVESIVSAACADIVAARKNPRAGINFWARGEGDV